MVIMAVFVFVPVTATAVALRAVVAALITATVSAGIQPTIRVQDFRFAGQSQEASVWRR